ncbi:hypothetical protein HanXRQr2_Chr01g0012341 [Helianthus annuus]|uniref:Uncharacterized protein n=1 Tax=Helianthus annuus TaxID=4232 RepID=A0A251SB14_HELAN|nr:hypothetical protein HanXRQr2_Chr01g0012341 [Helianthus annuus]
MLNTAVTIISRDQILTMNDQVQYFNSFIKMTNDKVYITQCGRHLDILWVY